MTVHVSLRKTPYPTACNMEAGRNALPKGACELTRVQTKAEETVGRNLGGHDSLTADERPSCSGEKGRSPQVVWTGIAHL